MKRYLLGAGLGLVTTAGWAQTEKDRNLLSAGVGGRVQRSEQYQRAAWQTGYQAFVSGGRFVRRDVLLGAEVSLASQATRVREGLNFDTADEQLERQLAFTPFARRYWGKQYWRVFLGGGVSFRWQQTRTQSVTTGPLYNQTRAVDRRIHPEIQAGFTYFLTSRWAVEATARSTVVPLSVSNLNIGLALLTGGPVRRLVKPPLPPNQLLSTNWIVAGGFELSNQSRELIAGRDRSDSFRRETGRSVSVNPTVGYLLADRLVVGVTVPVAYGEQTDTYLRTPDQQGVHVTRWRVGVQPFVKKYFNNHRLTPFLTARAAWAWQHDGQASDVYAFSAGAGLAYMLGTRFILEGELGGLRYGWSRERTGQRTPGVATPGVTTPGEVRQWDAGLDATLRPGFAISYVFL